MRVGEVVEKGGLGAFLVELVEVKDPPLRSG